MTSSDVEEQAQLRTSMPRSMTTCSSQRIMLIRSMVWRDTASSGNTCVQLFSIWGESVEVSPGAEDSNLLIPCNLLQGNHIPRPLRDACP